MEMRYKIIKQLGVINVTKSGWTTELNYISWNGANPKYDLRDWAPDHVRMGKGKTFSAKALAELKGLLNDIDIVNDVDAEE